jgi:hypothetical protein
MSDSLLLKESGFVEAKFPNGVIVRYPNFKVFVNGRETKIDIPHAGIHGHESIPLTKDVKLEYKGKTYDLGVYGFIWINCFKKSTNFQTSITCHQFTDAFLPEIRKSKNQHKNQGWFASLHTGKAEDLDNFNIVELWTDEL